MKKLTIIILLISFFISCVPVREGFVRRQTTGAPYNKSWGEMRERTSIPAMWK